MYVKALLLVALLLGSFAKAAISEEMADIYSGLVEKKPATLKLIKHFPELRHKIVYDAMGALQSHMDMTLKQLKSSDFAKLKIVTSKVITPVSYVGVKDTIGVPMTLIDMKPSFFLEEVFAVSTPDETKEMVDKISATLIGLAHKNEEMISIFKKEVLPEQLSISGEAIYTKFMTQLFSYVASNQDEKSFHIVSDILEKLSADATVLKSETFSHALEAVLRQNPMTEVLRTDAQRVFFKYVVSVAKRASQARGPSCGDIVREI